MIELNQILLKCNSVKIKHYNRYCCYTLLWCVFHLMYAIEIISGSELMWVAPWEGDPPRTLKIENAKTFKSEKSALNHIKKIKLISSFHSTTAWTNDSRLHTARSLFAPQK